MNIDCPRNLASNDNRVLHVKRLHEININSYSTSGTLIPIFLLHKNLRTNKPPCSTPRRTAEAPDDSTRTSHLLLTHEGRRPSQRWKRQLLHVVTHSPTLTHHHRPCPHQTSTSHPRTRLTHVSICRLLCS